MLAVSACHSTLQISYSSGAFADTRLSNHFFADIRQPDSIHDLVQKLSPDIVFHLAAQPLVRESYRKPLETWSTNVLGSLNVLESLKYLDTKCTVVMATTDKVYENREWQYGYRESDRLGGKDPYSASKPAELAIQSWFHSFCGDANHQCSHLSISTVRAGNVIAGGDWASERILPDLIRCISSGKNSKFAILILFVHGSMY